MLRWGSLLLLTFVLCCWLPLRGSTTSAVGFNVNSYPMVGANLQRNGMCANATVLQNSTLKVVWVFTEPDEDIFRDSPVYSADDNAVYAASYTGFIYGINATTGEQIWETCIGVPPQFPGDPCTDSGLDTLAYFPYGQVQLLSDGNVIILRVPEGKFQSTMVCLSKVDGSILWRLELAEYTVFASTPTPISQPGGWDAVLVWIWDQEENMNYTVINGTTGEIIHHKPYPDNEAPGPIGGMSYDPTDGTVITQYLNIVPSCGGDYPEFMVCTGVGKFDVLTGEHIWNRTLQSDWNNGLFALDLKRNSIYATTKSMEIYAYSMDVGKPLWKADYVVPGDEMGWASVCADGTILVTDTEGGNVIAYDPTPERVMKPKWGIGPGYPISTSVNTLVDNTFVFCVDNAVYTYSCVNGELLWVYDFGGTDNAYGPIPAVSNVGVFANVYWPDKGMGMIAFLSDARNSAPPFRLDL